VVATEPGQGVDIGARVYAMSRSGPLWRAVLICAAAESGELPT